jgi:hypothetical protein
MVTHNRARSEIKVATGTGKEAGNRDESRRTKSPSLTPIPPGTKSAKKPMFTEKANAPVQLGYMANEA